MRVACGLRASLSCPVSLQRAHPFLYMHGRERTITHAVAPRPEPQFTLVVTVLLVSALLMLAPLVFLPHWLEHAPSRNLFCTWPLLSAALHQVPEIAFRKRVLAQHSGSQPPRTSSLRWHRMSNYD